MEEVLFILSQEHYNAIGVLNEINIKKIDLIVVKLNTDGTFGNSKPCTNCLKTLFLSGINIGRIYYSTVDRGIIYENFSIINSNVITSGRRRSMK